MQYSELLEQQTMRYCGDGYNTSAQIVDLINKTGTTNGRPCID